LQSGILEKFGAAVALASNGPSTNRRRLSHRPQLCIHEVIRMTETPEILRTHKKVHGMLFPAGNYRRCVLSFGTDMIYMHLHEISA
jgi:hypothetical protein